MSEDPKPATSVAMPGQAVSTPVAEVTPKPSAVIPVLAGSPGDEQALALAVGTAVLAVLRQTSSAGQLPADLAGRLGLPGQPACDAALEPRTGASPVFPVVGPTPPVAQPAKLRRPAPGTQTIRAAVRRAQDIALAPDGSSLARLRITLLAIMLCVSMVAACIAYAISS